MTREQFYNMISEPSALTKRDVDELTDVVNDYPYFQAGWMLLLKSLHNIGDVRFSSELRRASIHVNNRTSLYKLIHHRQTIPVDEPSASTVVAPEVEQPTVIVKPVDVTTDYIEGIDLEYKTSAASTYTLDDYNDDIDEKGICAFTEWLDYINKKPEGEVKVRSTHDRNAELIDSFLNLGNYAIGETTDRQSSKVATEERREEAASEEETVVGNTMLTETLASIYVKQKNYLRAIEIYKGLCLKNPEKSIYFASRIKEIEKLID